jgi:hypothetical protein
MTRAPIAPRPIDRVKIRVIASRSMLACRSARRQPSARASEEIPSVSGQTPRSSTTRRGHRLRLFTAREDSMIRRCTGDARRQRACDDVDAQVLCDPRGVVGCADEDERDRRETRHLQLLPPEFRAVHPIRPLLNTIQSPSEHQAACALSPGTFVRRVARDLPGYPSLPFCLLPAHVYASWLALIANGLGWRNTPGAVTVSLCRARPTRGL